MEYGVNGASGGIGTMVVQMAKKAVGTGGKVVAVCSGRKYRAGEGSAAQMR
jgi:NADPH:quinone reductase-like Zn-dependent oxidoreductase